MPRSKKPTPATTLPVNATVVTAPSFTLAGPHGTAQYDFHPRGDECAVDFFCAGGRRSVTVPIPEARQLWSRLRRKGYEVF